MWKNIATNPPPENVPVWVTNGKACCLATLIKVKKGKKLNCSGNMEPI